MAEESTAPAPKSGEAAEASQIVEAGKVSRWLTENGFDNEAMEPDHQGVEIVKVD
ncbi:MAG TPA: NADH-quinone oxidoreductase subunit C, partial [Cyanobacteria bacterium UBA11049]|nr:NADH-quinone oxidoreductase subunit C [Cyanobacteria bacterium UBA11049]